MKLLKTPLRYPGGKAKAIRQIINYLPSDFSEYREPFIGGGSLFIYLKQTSPHIKFWINDLNYDLYCFWSRAKINMNHLISTIYNLKNTAVSGKDLFQELTTLNLESLSELERGVRFFVLNRITFSGTVDCGGFSQTAFESRFTRSSIERLRSLESLLQDTTITNLDYSQVINHPGQNVFLFLDPPYLTATNSKLYGKRGDLHTGFNHQIFANNLRQCEHKWLVTYDDDPEIRKNFDFAYVYEWQLQYGMNNYKQKTAAKGEELFITNFLNSQKKIIEYEQLLLF